MRTSLEEALSRMPRTDCTEVNSCRPVEKTHSPSDDHRRKAVLEGGTGCELEAPHAMKEADQEKASLLLMVKSTSPQLISPAAMGQSSQPSSLPYRVLRSTMFEAATRWRKRAALDASLMPRHEVVGTPVDR